MAGWWAEIAQVVAPTTAALVITGGTPTVTVDQNRIVVPSAAALTVTGGTPVVTATDHKIVTPTAATLSLTGGTPTVSVGVTVAPTAAALTITGGTPTVTATDHKIITPTGASLTITGGTPSLGLTLRPTGASLTITGGTPTVTVAVNQPTFLGATVTAGSSITLPTHAAGNYIQIFAYRGNSPTLPAKPSPGGTVPAWNDVDANAGANLNASRLVDFVATASNHTSGVWTADYMIASVWSGQHTAPVGGHAESGSMSTSGATAPSTTMTNTDGTSAMAHYLARRDSDWTAWGSVPAGYTTRASIGAGAAGVCLITKDSTTSDGSVIMPTDGSTSIGYRGQTVEIRQH